jgi:NAD(P)-dependent dehydrogenase (short-subunit alcohol dehydrogenase family)
LGAALTAEFIQRGHAVIGCSRSTQSIDRLRSQHKPPHHFAVVDVSDDEQVAAWAKTVLSVGGPPDLLLNNAALINSSANLWETSAEEFSQVIDVNIKGVFHVLRHYVPAMIERGEGVIVNFSSGWGRSISPQVGPYCGTKWAIEALTRVLADELPYGLAAIPLNPGIIHTEMLESCFGEGAAAYPSPQHWAAKAAPFLLELGTDDNGDALTAPV